jgi:DNA-binding transcriptional ArsR family regulator
MGGEVADTKAGKSPAELAELFQVLSVESRVKILQLLKERPLCVNALARKLGISPAAVSQHLRILRAASVVVPEKSGYFVHYRLDEKTLAGWRERTCSFLDPSGQKRRNMMEKEDDNR